MKAPNATLSDPRKSSAWRFYGRKWIRPRWIAALALPFLAWEMQRSVAAADSIFIVNTTGDEPDSVIADGVCETAKGNGQCTLRGAIQEANAQPTDTTITFNIPQTDPGYDGTFWTISLLSALPDLSIKIAMQGPGAELLTVQRSSGDVFRIFNVTSTGAVSLSGLTLEHGSISLGTGGGVRNESTGTVSLTNCVLSSNVAERGGAVSNESTGTVNVTNCTVSFNIADRGGGHYQSERRHGECNEQHNRW